MACELRVRLAAALQEFRREKVVRQNARLSLTSAIYDNAAIPRRKLLLSTGGANYRPPLERSKSAPKLGAIEEMLEEEEEQESEDDMEDEGSVSLAARVTGSASVSETTSDIVVDYDSGSEVASGGGGDRGQCVLEEEEEEDDDDDADKEFRGGRGPKLYHSDSLLYCPEPPLSPLTHQVLGVVSEDVDNEGDDLGSSGDQERRGDLGLLTSLTCDLTLAEESLTSDQPESLGSHCESCGSSCGACEASDQLESEQLEPNHDLSHTHKHSDHDLGHILEERDAQGKISARLEGDNISEESGYSEEKDSLQNVDPPKV